MNRVIGGVLTGVLALAIVGFTARGTAVEQPTDATRDEPAQVLGTQTQPEYIEIPLAPETPASTTSPAADPLRTASAPIENDPEPRPVTLAFTGDVIAHVAVADSARTGPGEYDFAPMFARISPVIQAADLAICHLETPLDPESRTPRGFPRFSAPAEVADALVTAGYDGCSTASNHVLDRGVSGVSDTLDVLDSVGLRYTGSARTPEDRFGILYDVGDVTIGHASYSYAVSGWLRSDQQWVANGLDAEAILADAEDLRKRGAEFVVVSLHWGTELQYAPTSIQVRLGEALMASSLVDLIVGHHAHLLQPIVEIDGKYVFYGLGNFLSNQEPGCCGEEAQEGAIMLVRLVPQADEWAVGELRYVPTWVDRHRDYVILSTLEADVIDHRHSTWLQRSAIRVGTSLQLEGSEMSIAEACEWMGADCAPSVEGAS